MLVPEAPVRVAIDVAVWRIRSAGIVLIVLAGIAALAGAAWPVAAALAIAGLALATSSAFLILRTAEESYRAIEQTLSLMSLPHAGAPDSLTLDIGGWVAVRLRRIGRSSILTFVRKHQSAERETYLIRTLLKYQRSIRIIF